jgi:imidazoleglycerol-phosphate dehydratase
MRQADVSRNTSETKIQISLNLDGTGKADLNSGVPFLDHMLDQIARHGMIDLKVDAKGDTHIDDHHTVEDVGITLGQAIAKAVGDKAGITRYGHSYVPLDETLSRVISLDGPDWNLMSPLRVREWVILMLISVLSSFGVLLTMQA